MAETTFETQVPTSLDNPKNRLYEFLCYSTAHFNIRATKEIMIAMDKNNAQTGKFAKYIGKVTDIAVTSGSCAGGLGPMSKGQGDSISSFEKFDWDNAFY